MERKTILREVGVTNSIIFKLPEQQDPAIAICFETKELGQQCNADLFEKYRKDKYSLNVWLTKTNTELLNVMLISDQHQRLYRDLGFNASQFKWWLQFTHQKTYDLNFKFYHIYMKEGKAQLIKTKTTNMPFVLTLHRFNLKQD